MNNNLQKWDTLVGISTSLSQCRKMSSSPFCPNVVSFLVTFKMKSESAHSKQWTCKLYRLWGPMATIRLDRRSNFKVQVWFQVRILSTEFLTRQQMYLDIQPTWCFSRGWTFFRLTHPSWNRGAHNIDGRTHDIIKSRPLVPVSSDSDAPPVLTPSMLLTQKVETPSASVKDFNVMTSPTGQRVPSLAD